MIEVRGVQKHFDDFVALHGVDLQVAQGELVALLGPSGSGKTTLLRIIAGLEVPDAGQVLLSGSDATATGVRDRQVGFVFQHYALFRHMSVFNNVAFGLRCKPRRVRPSKAAIAAKVHELLRLVQLDSMAHRFPAQLSGGQRQRVALARALAIEPQMLLLDEPFGALDAQVRQELRRWLRRLQTELRITTLLVTHDQSEALEVADRIVLMNKGRIEQVGSPAEVYERPATPFVYRFLSSPQHLGEAGFVRPHELTVARRGEEGDGAIEALVRRVQPLGAVVRLEVERRDSGEPLDVELSRERFAELALHVGELIWVTPHSRRVLVPDYAI